MTLIGGFIMERIYHFVPWVERNLESTIMVVSYLLIGFIIFVEVIRLDPVRVLKTALGGWLGFFAIGLVLWGIYTGILAPIAAGVGVDPIQFAVVFLIGAPIGFMISRYGLNLYVASGVTGVPSFRLLRYSTMYLFALVLCGFWSPSSRAFQKRSEWGGGGTFELINRLFSGGAAPV